MSYLLYFMKMRGDNMTPEEIREKINFNNKEIAKLLDPSVFILQPEVQELLDENNELREEWILRLLWKRRIILKLYKYLGGRFNAIY